MDEQGKGSRSQNDDVPATRPAACNPKLILTVAGIYGRPKGEYPDKDLKDLSRDEVFLRRRLDTIVPPGESKPRDRAAFAPGEGLADHWFFHVDRDDHGEDRPVLEERAVLMQSVEHYAELVSDAATSAYFTAQTRNGELSREESVERIIQAPTFGEQVIVRGCDASQLAIGDIFEVGGGGSSLKLEVSSPRLPCAYLDKKHNSPFGLKGIKCHTMTRSLAGWFCRVLVAGELLDEMQLVRTSHPHPKWTLSFLSKILYAEGDRRQLMRCKASWERDLELLRELCSLPQLGKYEWGDVARKILEEKEAGYES